MNASIIRTSRLFVLAALILPIGSQAQKGAKSVDYWPFKLGNTWIADASFGSKNVKGMVMRVDKVDHNRGETIATLSYKVGGKLTQTEVYRSSSKGLYRLAGGAVGKDTLEPPFPVISLPFAAGKNWKWEGAVNMGANKFQGAARFSSFAPKPVKIGTKTLQAIRIHVEMTISAQGQSQDFKNDYWFAPGVGLVKQTVVIGPTTIFTTVTSYDLKK